MPAVFSLLLLPSIAFAALRGPNPPAGLENGLLGGRTLENGLLGGRALFESLNLVAAQRAHDAVGAAHECDGKDFVCNHTDTHFAINSVHLESASNNHWSAGDTITATFSGHIKDADIEDGTIFYNIWELGVKHKVRQGSEDYFVCDTHECYRDHGKALQLQNPQDKSSNFTAKISFQLPPQRASGAMSINIWGHDQAHEPGVYDFMINLRLHYKESVQQISVDHDPRKFCSNNADCPSGSYCLNDPTKSPIPVYWCQGVGGYCKGDSDCPDTSYCMNYGNRAPIAYKYFCK